MEKIFAEAPGLAALSIISLLFLIFAPIYRKSDIGSFALDAIGSAGFVGSIIYAVLLGAELCDLLGFVLLFAIVSLCTFVYPSKYSNDEIRLADSEDEDNEF